MADTNCIEQFTAYGFFTLGYSEAGVYKEVSTPYISERQRAILEARSEEESEIERGRRLSN
jgi:hypothetical protein